MPADPEDIEVRAAILASHARSASEIAAELVARFGPDRAWPADMVSKAAYAERSRRRAWRRTYADDPDILAFILDHAGLTGMDEIARRGADRFGKFPGKSSVHRIITRFRAERAQEPRPHLQAI